MSRVYSSLADLVMMELRPAIATDDTLTGDQVEAIADEVCTRLQAAGLVVWDDGWSEARGVYWLPAQGFRMVTTDDDGAAFWGVVSDVLSEQTDDEGVSR